MIIQYHSYIFLPCTVECKDFLQIWTEAPEVSITVFSQVTPDRNNAFFLPVQGSADFWGVHTSHPLTVTEPHKGYR